MSDQDVFNSDNAPAPKTVEDLLSSIKNEQGEPKYKTVEDGIKALNASQEFINKLLSEKKAQEEELARIREEQGKQKSIEEVLKQLTAKEPEVPTPPVVTPPQSGLSEEAVADLVQKQFAAVQQATQLEKNYNEVQATLKQKFGEKTSEVIAAKAAELGTTPKELGELAKSKPQMVLALFASASKAPVTPSTSSVNLPHTPPNSELARPEKSLLLGATTKDITEYMRKVKEDVYKRHNVTA